MKKVEKLQHLAELEMSPFTVNLAEIWTLYSLGTLMICARTFVRVRTVGVRGFRPDDYLVWFAWVSCWKADGNFNLS